MRLSILITAAVVSGCAFGNEYDYRAATAPVPEISADTLAVAVADHRPYVLNGEKRPDFVGLQRGGFGNPFSVTTESGAPLADDLAVLLTNSFIGSGTRVETILLPPGASDSDALARFQSTSADRLLLIEMREWKTDHYAQVTVHWDLAARVYDQRGTLLGQDRIQGTQGTGEGYWSLESGKSRIATGEAKRRFGELLSKPSIVTALSAP